MQQRDLAAAVEHDGAALPDDGKDALVAELGVQFEARIGENRKVDVQQASYARRRGIASRADRQYFRVQAAEQRRFPPQLGSMPEALRSREGAQQKEHHRMASALLAEEGDGRIGGSGVGGQRVAGRQRHPSPTQPSALRRGWPTRSRAAAIQPPPSISRDRWRSRVPDESQ